MAPAKAALADQLDLFDQELRRLEWIPFEFRYRFRCADGACTGHDMGLKDWEAGESYRKYRRTYGEQAVLDKLRERWFDRMVTPDRAVHCFVGNIAARPHTFMLLSLFSPSGTSSTSSRTTCSPCRRRRRRGCRAAEGRGERECRHQGRPYST